MKLPHAPPQESPEKIFQLPAQKLQALLGAAVRCEAEGKYRHWEILRHLPTPNGFRHEDWWGAIKLVRRPALKPLPLTDAGGKPFRYAVTDMIARLLHEIDLGAGGNIGMPDPIVNPQTRSQYVMHSLFQEAVTSSQLEGAATTRAVAKEMLRTGRPPQTRGERMILNNYVTMQRIAEWKQRQLDEELIFEMHRMVTEGTLDNPDAGGRLRRADEKITVQDTITGEVFYSPPPAGQLKQRLRKLCEFANGSVLDVGKGRGRFIHPVVRAILLHFWLAYDHPFVDGNGRTARALFYWSMLRQGYWLFEFVSISEILVKAPAQYATSFLYTETDGNDATYFLLYQCEVIRRAIATLHQYIERKSKQLREIETTLKGTTLLNHRQQALITHALRHPGSRYTIEGHRRSHGVAYETARYDLLGLVKSRLLEPRKVGRAFAFVAPADIGDRLHTPRQQRQNDSGTDRASTR
jgi:Fic family protein